MVIVLGAAAPVPPPEQAPVARRKATHAVIVPLIADLFTLVIFHPHSPR